MVETWDKKTLSVTIDQHEAVTNLKRGKDTIYDVVDRLLVPPGLEPLEEAVFELDDSIALLEDAVHELKEIL